MSNVGANTDLGKLVIINLNWIQLVIGLCEQYLASSQDIPNEYNWFKNIRTFLNQNNGKLYFPEMSFTPLKRVGDKYIMAELLSITPRLSANQLRYIFTIGDYITDSLCYRTYEMQRVIQFYIFT